MKKTGKSCLYVLLGFILFVVLGMVIMFVAKICPPSGPWPMPPWCSVPGLSQNTETLPNATSQNNGITLALPVIATPNPYPVENTWGYVAPTPTVADGTAINLRFMVALPDLSAEDEAMVNIGGNAYPLHSEDGIIFESDSLPAKAGESLDYYYSSAEGRTAEQSVTPQSDFTVMDGLNWTDQLKIDKPGFVKGYGMMDFGGFNIAELRGGRLPSTLDSLKMNGGEWYMYDYYWSYTDYTLPEIVDEAQFPDTGNPNESDFKQMADEVHQSGLKFILLASLEWSAIPGNPCHQYHGDPDKLAECSNNYWLEGRQYEYDMLDRLQKNPNDPEALAYRDKWFAQYRTFLEYVAKIAEENHIEMIIIGKNTAFAHSPIHEDQWRELIQDIRTIYHGQIASIFECYNDTCMQGQPWMDDLDAAVLFYWFSISDADNPSNQELAASIHRINQSVITPFYQTYSKPVILLTPFMSRDHPARAEWVEPASSAPDVGIDLAGQAELYQLLMEDSIDEEWFSGVVPYGYWFFDGFSKDFAFDRAYSVRNKPAGLLLRSWFDRIND